MSILFFTSVENGWLSPWKYHIDIPEITQTDNILNGCKGKFFHVLEKRCGYDIRFTHQSPSDEVFNILKSNGSNLFSSQFKRFFGKNVQNEKGG